MEACMFQQEAAERYWRNATKPIREGEEQACT